MIIANSKQEAINLGTSFFYHNKPCTQGHKGIWRWRKIKNSSSVQIECRKCCLSRSNRWKQETNYLKTRNRSKEKINYELKSKAQKRYEEKIKQRRLTDPEFDYWCRKKKTAKYMVYYTQKLKATPNWVNRKALEEVYLNCPEGYEVDHIIPLKGKNVCGLHVPWNLQYLTKIENLKKSNKILEEFL